MRASELNSACTTPTVTPTMLQARRGAQGRRGVGARDGGGRPRNMEQRWRRAPHPPRPAAPPDAAAAAKQEGGLRHERHLQAIGGWVRVCAGWGECVGIDGCEAAAEQAGQAGPSPPPQRTPSMAAGMPSSVLRLVRSCRMSGL
jgi:hypothetical protein